MTRGAAGRPEALEVGDEIDQLLHGHRVVEGRHLRRAVLRRVALARVDHLGRVHDRLGEVLGVVHGAHHRQLGPHVLPVLCGGERLPLDLVALVALELRERLPPLRGLALRQTERPALGRAVLAVGRRRGAAGGDERGEGERDATAHSAALLWPATYSATTGTDSGSIEVKLSPAFAPRRQTIVPSATMGMASAPPSRRSRTVLSTFQSAGTSASASPPSLMSTVHTRQTSPVATSVSAAAASSTARGYLRTSVARTA